MKKFFVIGITFLIVPIIFNCLITLAFPVHFFTNRSWEAVVYYKLRIFGAFYPSQTVQMNEVGDLGHHTNLEIKKPTKWITDEIGFRNNKYIKKPDILLVGDSFIAGTSLDQQETITNQLSSGLAEKNAYTVYNFAPASFSHFAHLLKLGVIEKPKVVIFSIVERDIPKLRELKINENAYRLRSKVNSFPKLSMFADRFLKMDILKWTEARLYDYKGNGIQSPLNGRLLFLQGSNAEIIPQAHQLNITEQAISSYKRFCDALNIKFVFLPIPNKETVCYKYVPFNKQPSFLLSVDSILRMSKIPTINTLKLFNRQMEKGIQLYHYDDTHWNENATKAMSIEIIEYLQQTGDIR